MDLNALFKITYGLFVAAAEDGGRLNGCIINTASQVTAEPPRLIVTMLKSNLTSELIRRKGSLAVSVLAKDCPMDIIQNFGYQSGRQADKFAAASWQPDGNGNPVLTKHAVASYALRIEETVDVDTHWLFLCAVEDARTLSEAPALTYDDYRALKSGGTPAAPAGNGGRKSYVCTVCHYVYEGDIPFEELPDDYVCPVCGVPKSLFVQQ